MQEKKKSKKKLQMTAGDFYSRVLDSETAHTSFGKLILAKEKSAPQFCILTKQ